jgi:hypothetical protein
MSILVELNLKVWIKDQETSLWRHSKVTTTSKHSLALAKVGLN